MNGTRPVEVRMFPDSVEIESEMFTPILVKSDPEKFFGRIELKREGKVTSNIYPDEVSELIKALERYQKTGTLGFRTGAFRFTSDTGCECEGFVFSDGTVATKSNSTILDHESLDRFLDRFINKPEIEWID